MYDDGGNAKQVNTNTNCNNNDYIKDGNNSQSYYDYDNDANDKDIDNNNDNNDYVKIWIYKNVTLRIYQCVNKLVCSYINMEYINI